MCIYSNKASAKYTDDFTTMLLNGFKNLCFHRKITKQKLSITGTLQNSCSEKSRKSVFL